MRLAEQKGFTSGGEIAKGMKAGQTVDWLKNDFDLGRGHTIALVALLKGYRGSSEPKSAKPAAGKMKGGGDHEF